MDDFEIVESTRGRNSEIVDLGEIDTVSKNSNNKIDHAIADNMSDIINLASDMIKIKELRVRTNSEIAKMEANRKNLIAEADAYVKKKQADSNMVIDRMEALRLLLKDFYSHIEIAESRSMSGDEFINILREVL